MIKIQEIVRNIVIGEFEAYEALMNGYMNMSAYATRIKPEVETLAKKPVTINSLVVSLIRLKKELQKEKPLSPEVTVTNITTKLPLSEIIYENSDAAITQLESLHKKISISRKDFFTATISTTELSIICSSNITDKVLKHFDIKEKFIKNNLAAVGVSFDSKHFDIPNTLFSLMLVMAKARVNIAEIVSTYTELIFIIAEKDFSQTVTLFSELHKKSNRL
ncbi:MAG: hypothetical protein NT094_02020 [Candidatus Staskawiczbacteria bacterium]|nr:hypothetical protein [Candidatus Staskawiczbacteria bacterium]